MDTVMSPLCDPMGTPSPCNMTGIARSCHPGICSMGCPTKCGSLRSTWFQNCLTPPPFHTASTYTGYFSSRSEMNACGCMMGHDALVMQPSLPHLAGMVYTRGCCISTRGMIVRSRSRWQFCPHMPDVPMVASVRMSVWTSTPGKSANTADAKYWIKTAESSPHAHNSNQRLASVDATPASEPNWRVLQPEFNAADAWDVWAVRSRSDKPPMVAYTIGWMQEQTRACGLREHGQRIILRDTGIASTEYA